MGQSSQIKVGIADYKLACFPEQIITLGLGSCVGITLYDKRNKIGGMVHIMLPDSTQFKNKTNLAKYADTGIPLLLDEIIKLGARKIALQAKIAGGAQMFNFGDNKSSSLKIGQRNIEKSKMVLKELGIKLIAEDVGGNNGRTIILDTETGELIVRTMGNPLRTI